MHSRKIHIIYWLVLLCICVATIVTTVSAYDNREDADRLHKMNAQLQQQRALEKKEYVIAEDEKITKTEKFFVRKSVKEKNVCTMVQQADEEKLVFEVWDYSYYRYSVGDYFILVNEEGHILPFRKDVVFNDSFCPLEQGKTYELEFKWKKYFTSKLKKGKYTMYWIKKIDFEIK